MRMRWLQAVLGFAALVSSPFACTGDRDGFEKPLETNFPEAGADTSGPECAGKVICSRDLRSVVDACDESRIVTACAPAQGCADGRCVAACDAAVSSGASVGCEFATLPPSRFFETHGSCFAAFIANNWATPVRIEAEYQGRPLDVKPSARVVRTSGENSSFEPFDGELKPGEVAVLYLAQSPEALGTKKDVWVRCPDGATPAIHEDVSLDGTTRGSSFRIKTSAPVSAYSIWPFRGGDSWVSTATLLLPTSAWSRDYLVTTAGERILEARTNPTAQIIAAEDDTEVTLIGSVAIQPGQDVEGSPKGVPHTYRLARGEVLQLAQPEDITGSRLVSNKAVAVMGGHECFRLPANVVACDAAQQQLFPIRSWGHEHVVVPHLSRLSEGFEERYFHRIVGAVDGTLLTYEPARPTDAPKTLASGESAIFTTNGPFVVRSQDADHPIQVFTYMSSAEFSPARLFDGDPEFATVVPTEQYLDHYSFFVDMNYRNSHLVVVRARPDGREFEPVTLDCGGALEGWKPVGSQGKYEYVHVPLESASVHQKVGTGTCGPGRREMDSRGPFSVAVWGTDVYTSYSYPGGAAIRTINDVPPPVVR